MSNFFGKTWWGAQWLNSLAHIDHSNRLPRGSAYAKKGAVRSLEIDGNSISAKVQGNQPKPYKIKITVPSFSEKEVKALADGLAEKPVVISKLLNRELDAEALKIAEQKGLRVFPRKWSDFEMKCSCPDWAVPCKHLAAVIYKVSAEIDNNPFLIFQLHNVDLLKELEKVDVHVSAKQTEIPSFAEVVGLPSGKPGAKAKAKSKVKAKAEAEANPPAADAEAALRSVDFSALTPIADALVQLLPDKPVFYQQAGNFRDKYALLLRKAGKNAQRILASKASLGAFFSLLPALERAASMGGATASLITHHTKIQLSVSGDSKPAMLLDGKREPISLEEFIPALWAIPAAHLCDYQPSVAALHTLLLYAVNLAANGAVTPQIVKFDGEQYHIRWLPAVLSSEVRALTEKLEPLLPQGLLLWREETPLDENKAVEVTSVFLSALLHRLSKEEGNRDIFLNLFFGGAGYTFSLPGEEALSGGISAWLQRYYIAQGKYRPGIVVDEREDGRFCVSVNVEDNENPLAKPTPLSDMLNLKKYDKIRFEALQALTPLGAFIPGLDRYINAKGKAEIVMSNAEFAPFLMQVIPVIHLLNINVLLPKSLQEILRPRASVQVRQKNKDNTGFMRLETLLDFEWQVALGDATVSEAEFKAILKNSAGLIKYKAQYIYVSSDDLSKLHKHFSSDKMLSPYEMLRTALSSDYYGAKVALTNEVKELVEKLTHAEEVPLPKALSAQLRPYQQRGFAWMYRNAQIGFGSLIADDMGLGKTLQVIAVLLKFKETGALKKEKALVVVPTGLLANWQAEIEKFAPSLTVKFYHGAGRKLEEDDAYDMLLTSYGVARSDALALKKKKWRVVVIDEAQNIKNYETAQSKAIKSIPAATFVAMSGTPVENRLSELWSIMDFCNRSFLGTLGEFREVFANPIQNQHDVAAAGKLKQVTAPFMMRRLKSDKSIISDLPEKIEIDSFAYLAKAQAGLYKKTLHEAMKSIEAIEETDSKSLFVRQGLVLQMILALKQICNHPTHFLKNNVLDASLSGKMDLLFEKLSSIVEANEKVLIFTQFTEMGSLLQRFIAERFGEKPLFYHGGCTLKQRRAMVDTFQSGHADKLFILSLKAAGTGLNLTAASHVIHYDLWWNPAVEAQATDRAYRIGQKNNVMVHRFITKGTFEERINEMIQRKKNLADLTISTGESWIGNFSNKELREIFELGKA
ncbi:MAG: DEAD/DEAH box helicase family protein [Prevotellaceae bacterium]|jgi:uncharacterized Zn finger protein/ERCC4-related helicase|nr:DEAD/DEAH box helicase family protein [Prevotellaceae bacterium]